MSVSSASFAPAYVSSPAPRSLFSILGGGDKEEIAVSGAADEAVEVSEADEGVLVSDVEGGEKLDLSVLSETPFYGFADSSLLDKPHQYANISELVNYESDMHISSSH